MQNLLLIGFISLLLFFSSNIGIGDMLPVLLSESIDDKELELRELRLSLEEFLLKDTVESFNEFSTFSSWLLEFSDDKILLKLFSF